MSEEYLSDKEEAVYPTPVHKVVEEQGNASGTWNQKRGWKRGQEAGPECERPSMLYDHRELSSFSSL